MKTELKYLFKEIKKEFCDLWKFKELGQTLEIVTSQSTTTNKFVSVFLTQRDNFYIVSDGGWMETGVYEAQIDSFDENYNRLFDYYERFYEIKRTVANGITYFFKKTDNIDLLSSLIYDISTFISVTVSAAQIRFKDLDDSVALTQFASQANAFVSSSVPVGKGYNISFRKPLDASVSELNAVKFSAVIEKNSNLVLINYVTGSNPQYFQRSIANANINFEVADRSSFRPYIKQKFAIINDEAPGFEPRKLSEYLNMLQITTKHKNLYWNRKDSMPLLEI